MDEQKKPDTSKDYMVLGALGGITAALLLALANAFVLKTLWNWFLADLAVPINLSAALGICLISGMLKYRSRTPDERAKDREHLLDSLFQWAQYCVLILAFGWLCSKLLA